MEIPLFLHRQYRIGSPVTLARATLCGIRATWLRFGPPGVVFSDAKPEDGSSGHVGIIGRWFHLDLETDTTRQDPLGSLRGNTAGPRCCPTASRPTSRLADPTPKSPLDLLMGPRKMI